MSQRHLPATSGVKVKRYFPGKAPAPEENQYSSSEDSENEHIDIHLNNKQESDDEENIDEYETKSHKIQIETKINRAIPSTLPTRAEASSSESDDEELDARAQVRALALERQKQLALQQSMAQQGDESEVEDDSEESEEASSEEESSEDERVPLVKPVFIPKNLRTSTLEKEKLAKEAEELEKLKLKEIESRKQESKQAVQDIIRKEIELAKASKQLETEVDDTDDLDPEAEYEEWKLRELLRIKRDKEEREAIEKEREEIERRRNMTEIERLEEDLKRREEQQKEKELRAKPVFLQKYHHKGAFFMDLDEDVYKRDAMEVTEGEIKSKSSLPKPMQVKNFGRAGQTKYTHLKDQDTTKDSPWYQVNSKHLKKLGGLHNYHEDQKNIQHIKRRKKDE